MAVRFDPLFQALDGNGDPISGAKLNFYQTGTSTPLDTYSDNALSTANANPVVADSAGRFGDIFLQVQDYKVVYTDASDVVIDTLDPVHGAASSWAKGADIASAATLVLGTDGNYFDVTGTTTITAIATWASTGPVKLHFDGALTLTHHATDLVLPGGANITTAAGDEAEFVEYASGDWRCTVYTRATGEAVVVANLPYDIAFNAGYDATATKQDVAVQSYAKLDMVRSGSFTGEAASIETAPTGAALIIDIEKNGTSIYTTAPRFADGATTLTAGVLKTDGTEDFVAGDTITFKVTQIGSTTAGQGVTFTLKGVSA